MLGQMNGWIDALGWLSAFGVVVTVEQLLAAMLRRWYLYRVPLVSDPVPEACYERSLFTPASGSVRRLWLGLAVAASLLWLGHRDNPLWWALAGVALGLTLWRDLRSTESVAVSPWQVAWRRGWGRPVRRLPLEKIAHIHLMQRGLWQGPSWLTYIANQWLGSSYIVLQLHDRRTVTLPRTGRWLGHGGVEQVARELRRRKRRNDRERARSMRHDHYLRLQRRESAAHELALRRELLSLRLAARRNEAQRVRQARQSALQFDTTQPSDLQDLPPLAAAGATRESSAG